ncbi:hypothetical protein Sinme_5597 [Sinorhizobium meliloti AK83]|nr:hypothetical protein Sinme_5597 [Sinorhizobium meliloti AK83]
MSDHPHHHGHDHHAEDRWKHNGVRVIKGDQLDDNTAQTPGMYRQAAINHARVGAQKIWAGTVAIEPNAKTGVHHHGPLESVIFVVRGKARMRWGDRLDTSRKPARATSSTYHPLCHTKKSMPIPRTCSNACWCDPTTRRWWSISRMSIRWKSRRKSIGSIRSTNIQVDRLGASVSFGWTGCPVCGTDFPSRCPAVPHQRMLISELNHRVKNIMTRFWGCFTPS